MFTLPPSSRETDKSKCSRGNCHEKNASERKEQRTDVKKCGVVYSVKCGTCDKEYIGETARALGTRLKEHTDGKHQSSAITEHQQVTGHLCDTDNVKVLTQEERFFPRKIREALKIHQRRPALNRDKGYEVPPVILQLLPRDFRSHVTSTQQWSRWRDVIETSDHLWFVLLSFWGLILCKNTMNPETSNIYSQTDV